jgi:hypothetical protein
VSLAAEPVLITGRPSSRLRLVPTLRAMGTMPGTRRTDVPSIQMAARTEKPLLSPGNETEWERLGAEKRKALTPPPDTPVSELLRRGQHLSAQAGALLRAVERADAGSRS